MTEVSRCDAELASFVRGTSGMMRARAEELRVALRAACVVQLFADPVGAKDVEFRMWKQTAHVPINYLRGRLRRLRKPRKKKARGEGRAAKSEYKQLKATLLEFVSSCSKFYAALLARLESDARAAQRRGSIHRCLLFLGDLARYRELYTGTGDARSKPHGVWAEADRCYRHSLVHAPMSGHPHNQLAVLASYREFHVVVVYRYVRALCAAEPFPTAGGNLVSLFQKHAAAPAAAAAAEATPVQLLYSEFVRYHGLLFLAHSEPRAAASPAEAARRGLTRRQRVDALESMHKKICSLLENGIREGTPNKVGDAALFKLVVINVYSIAAALRPELRHVDARGEDSAAMLPGLLSTADASDASAVAHAGDLSAMAGAIAFDVAAVIAEEAARCIRADAALVTSAPWLGLMAPLAVFCDWLRAHRNNRFFGEGARHSPSSSVPQDMCAAALNKWKRASVSLVDALRSVPGLVEAAGVLRAPHSASLSVRESTQPLKETVDMRGFLPLERVAPAIEPNATPLPTGLRSVATRFLKIRVAVELAAAGIGRCESDASSASPAAVVVASACGAMNDEEEGDGDEADGETILFHAGSKSRQVAASPALRAPFASAPAPAATSAAAPFAAMFTAPPVAAGASATYEERSAGAAAATASAASWSAYEVPSTASVFGAPLWSPTPEGSMWGGESAAVAAAPWGFDMPGLPDPKTFREESRSGAVGSNPFL